MNTSLSLSILPEAFAICRLPKESNIPSWALQNDFFSITKTMDEVSLVCEENHIPSDIQSEKGWKAFKVEGPLDFALTGILSSLATPLAKADISIFAISTYDTDYILVKEENLKKASEILSSFCHIF